ncbi:MAG: hypothetical protein GX786_09310 [Clostridiales bacterium]|nr:hypothetical protein [Clostridiales bacterium]
MVFINKKFFLSLVSILLISILFFSFPLTAFATAQNTDIDAIVEEERFFPYFQTWLKEIKKGSPFTVQTSLSIHELVPFTEETVASLDRLLGNIQANFSLQDQGPSLIWETELAINGTSLFTVGGSKENNHFIQWTNIDTLAPFISRERQPIFELLGAPVLFEENGPLQFVNFENMKEHIPNYLVMLQLQGEEKKSSYQFKNIGKASTLVTYKFVDAEVMLLQTFLSNLLQSGEWEWGRVSNNQLIYQDSGTLKVYYQDGSLLGIEASCEVLKENEAFQLETMWAFNEKINRFSIDVTAKKGKDRLLIEGEISKDEETNQLLLNGKYRYRNSAEEKNTEATVKGMLESILASNNERVTGEIEIAVENGETLFTYLLQPSVLFTKTATSSYAPKGTLRMTSIKDKKTQKDITLSFLMEPLANTLTVPNTTPIDYDRLGETEKENVAETISLHFTSAFAKAIFQLPEKDLIFIIEGLTKENINEIDSLLPKNK